MWDVMMDVLSNYAGFCVCIYRYGDLRCAAGILFCLAESVIAYICYDKSRKHPRRIPEITLLALGFCGGAAGAIIGMKVFRYHIKRMDFWVVNIAGLFWQIPFVWWLWITAFDWYSRVY